MDKNKNRTDLLAAGRKKLQQYRQKKDGKGSKSSGKANKPGRDVVAGDSSSVAKSSPEQVSGTELVELSSQASTDTSVATNADVAAPDPSSTSVAPIEVSKVDDSVSNEDLQSSNRDDVIPTFSPPKIVNIEGKLESGLSVGLKGVLDNSFAHKAGEMIAAHGEDQVPDVGTLQEDNRTSLIDVEGDMNQVNSGDVEKDAKMEESTSSAIEQTSEERDGFPAFVNADVNSASGLPSSSDQERLIGDSGDTNADEHEPTIGDSSDANADVHSASALPSSDHEPAIDDSGDTNADAQYASVLPSSSDHEPTIGDSGVSNAEEHSLSGLLYSDHGPAIGDSGDTNADVHSASVLPPSSDLELTIGDSGVSNADEQSLSGLLYSDHGPAIGDSSETNADVYSVSGLPYSDRELTIGDSGVSNADEHSLSGLLYSYHGPVIGDSGVSNADVHSVSGLPSSDHELTYGDSGVSNADEHSLSGLLYSDQGPAVGDSSDSIADVHSFTVGDSGVSNANEHSLSGLLYSDLGPAVGDSSDSIADVHSFTVGDSGVSNADEHSLSGLLYSDHVPAIGDSSDSNADVHSVTVGDSGVSNADEHSLSGLLYSDQGPAIRDSGDTDADVRSASVLPPSSDHEVAIADSGDTNEDVVVDIHTKSGSAEFPEKLKEQLYINNFEKELVHLQLCEERDVRKEFEQHHLQWENEKSSFITSIADLEGKNRTLSEEIAECRSELNTFANKMEELDMSVSFSKTEFDWSSSRIQELETELSNVSSELVDSKSLVSDLQVKNETLNVNVASLTEEKDKLEKEKGDVILENKKLSKDLMECKSLLQSAHVEKVNVKETLALVMEEMKKLEEAKQKYVSEKDKLLSDWKKLEEVLASEREERSKNNEANDHFIQENNKVSMELLESKKLMESLESEIANLSENLDLVTKERTKLGEDLDHLRFEKEECLTELTSCKTLLKNLQVEYEESMNESRDSALRLEKLTEENVTLTSNLGMYKAKVTELDDWKMKSEERASHGKLEELTEAMKEQSNSFEEIFLKNVILDEVMKQYVHTVESKKGDLVNLCEDLRQEVISTKTQNSELTENLHNSESRIHELQLQVDDMASFSNQLELLHRKLDASIEGISTIHSSEAIVGDNIFARVATSVDAAVEVIQDLQEKLEDSLKTRNSLSDSYKEMSEKIKDLEQTNELAAYVIHRVFDNLQKIVNGSTEESEDDTRNEQLDHLEISNYDVFIERLIMILRERAQLETKNREYNLDLLRRIKDLEESNRKLNNPAKDLKLMELQTKVNQLTSSIIPYEIESSIYKESLRSAIEQIAVIQSETKIKETELHQSENRVSALREKLHIAVTKGKGLIQQRDTLKQNLTMKDAALQELETKLKSYSEAGERMEALESELSYIRNSATALRESFLLKDSVLQRIEEILEDLDLPEHFHDRDIIDKIDWLAKSVSHEPSQTGVIERAHSYPGSGPLEGWKEDLEPVSDELRRNYEDLQNKFYELAEQNEMLEQSLMERNNLVQRCEEVLEKTNMPLHLRSLEPEDKIDWLRVVLAEANDRCAHLEESLMERDSLVQRCEEVLEKTNMPPHLQSSELEHKIDWLRVGHSEANDLCALLEESLMERNSLVQRCEEVLEKTNMPPHMQSSELEHKIDWLRGVYSEANDRCALLEQSLMEKSKIVQRCEDVLEKTNMPPHLQSSELEHKIGWLCVVLSEANDRCALLQQDLEKIRGSLSADLEESNRRLLDVEANLKSIADERDQILAHFEAQSQDYNKIKEEVSSYEIENVKLKNEIDALQLKLDEKHVDEEQIQHVNGEIKRLQDLVKNMLQDPEMEDFDSSMNDIQSLEGLLRKLEEKYPKYPSGERSIEQLEVLERKLEEVEGDLVQVKDERDKHMEKSQSLVNEVEALEVKNQELQKLLVQEEQKTGVVREKLNVAVRKGKSLIQQRDTMKQNINELTAEVARLTSEIKVRENTLLDSQEKMKESFKTINELTAEVAGLTSEIKVRENTLLGHQEKMKDLFTLQELVENKDSEIRFLKNRVEEILSALGKIDVGVELKNNDPIEKIEKKCRDLQDGILSAEQDSRKSKRAAELLLEELNEVQERNEDLVDEISKLSREKDSAEAAMRDSLSHLEQLSALHLDERSSQFEELMNLKSDFEQLKPELRNIYNLVNDVLPKDLDHFYNLESSVKSLLESSDASNTSLRKDSKDNLFLDTKREEEHSDDDEIVDLWRFVGTHMEDLISNISLFEEKLEAHSKSLHEEAVVLSETVSTLHKEMTSTCKNSVFEMEKVKGQMVSDDESLLFIEGDTLSVSEEQIMNMVNRLLSHVKDFHSFQTENMEANLKEMKERISSLQKELTEKDVQKDRICVDLVNQIKRAEASAMSNLQQLESSKTQVNDLKGQLEAVNAECKALQQRVKEVEESQEEKVKSLTHALTSKEQEAEALLQVLDEEEAQMEDLTNKITELEKLMKQKDHDLANTEAARGKALKKLSITVNKFDELHHLSETLVSEIDNLQSQLQERDSEISFLRDEITRCTSDSLQALESDKKGLDSIQDILTWLQTQDLHLDDNNGESNQVHEYKETLKNQITTIVSELKELRQVAQSKDELLHIERSKREILESSMREQESRLSLRQDNDESARGATSITSEIVEVEPVINTWQPKGTTSQVRSLRKVNNDQLAISIDDVDSDEKDKLEDEDDDKSHGFKSLTTSKLVPKFTRPVTNFIDGLWVSCDRALQRQPFECFSFVDERKEP
ncbi:unnamed protein product [Lactuca saligna]|uniref:Uncharacterized protein n=1 Tax=Lactuca saligna TaxID=75948 RepID=A0AA35Z319_LACSI|nr:unnamed protein product [Lactuca saligna]